MFYTPPNPDKNPQDSALGPALLTGVFSAFFTLSLTVVAAPYLLRSLPEATLAGIIGLALFYSIYAWLTRDLRLPFLFHVLIFLFFQWLGLFRICLEQKNFPTGMLHPLALIHTQPWWFTMTAAGGLLALFFSNSLLALQKLPKPLPPNPREIYSDTLHLSVGPWEQNWKSWRFGIFGTVVITALSYLVGYAYLDLKHSAFWAGIFLWLQLGLGVWLILIGHFYYRRAVWKAVDLAPDRKTKRLWGRELAVWFSKAAFASLILPVNWRLNQWWLVKLFLGLFHFLTGGNPEARLDPQKANNLMKPPKTPSMNSNWIMELITLFYNGILLLLALAGLLMVLILIGSLIQRFFAKETDRLKGLPKALLKLYLFWRDWWRRIRERLGQPRNSGDVPEGFKLGEAKDPTEKLTRGSFGMGPRAVIRRGYYRLIQQARMNGYPWRQDQTPKEIAADLNSMLPTSEKALDGIADSYQQARYGPKPPTGVLARIFERLRREVQNRLRLLGRGD